MESIGLTCLILSAPLLAGCTVETPPPGLDTHAVYATLDEDDGLETGDDGTALRQGLAQTSSLTSCSATTLEGLVSCVLARMPGAGSEGFFPPTPGEQTDYYAVATQMLGGACNFALPQSLSTAMRLLSFRDGQTAKNYCVLMEVGDLDGNGIVDRGWGTLIIDPAADRELSHQVPHPVNEPGTEAQAVSLFKATGARTFLMCGAHRLANADASACDPSYAEADCVHGTANMYFSAVQAIDAFYTSRGQSSVQIQWHGMADTTCPGVNAYLSHGTSAYPSAGSSALALQASLAIRQPAWSVEVAGEGTCWLDATNNVDGRFLNGIPSTSVCALPALSISGKFLHIEQQPDYRLASAWLPAVLDAFPGVPPPAPTSPQAVAGDAQVLLSWSSSLRARSYSVYVRTSSGGAYSLLGANIAGTSYTHAGATNGTTYRYIVTATGIGGESAPSAEVNATPFAPLSSPTGLTGTGGNKKVILSWNAASGAISYKVARATVSSGPFMVVGTTSGTTYTSTGLSSKTTYYFFVIALSASGATAPSSVIAVTTT
jgi:hypothetical protein